MKIAIFTDSFHPMVDGVVISVKNSASMLGKKGHDIIIFAPSGSILPKEMEKLGIKIVRLKSSTLKSYKEYKVRIPNPGKSLNAIKEFNPDIIHVHSPGGIGIEGLICAKKLNIPSIITAHSMFASSVKHLNLLGLEKTGFMQEIVWKSFVMFLNSFNCIIAPSKPMKKELEKHGVKKHIYAISNGIDTKRFSPISHKKKYGLIYVGRLVYEKNIITVLKALKRLSEKGINLSFAVAGRGPELNNLKKYADENNLNVKFLGLIKNEKLPEIYNKSKIFITASVIETEGLTIVEAMACGLPIISVKFLAIPSVVKNNVNGILSAAYDDRTMAENIEKLICNRKLREKMSKMSIKLSKKYSLDKTNNELEQLYIKLRRN
jgi:glycosyltransferase involved in cell wall biosynthesis